MTARMAEQFDMFSEEASRDRVVKRDTSKHAKPEQPTVYMSEEEMVRHLSQTGRYRTPGHTVQCLSCQLISYGTVIL